MTKDVEVNFCWMLARANHVLGARIASALEATGVSPRGHHVLFKAMLGEFTQTELARKTGLDKTTMVVTLDELEAQGLAERRPSRRDRRAHVIAVTPAGKRKVRESKAIAARVHREVLGALPEPEREAFVNALEHLLDGPLADPVIAVKHRQRALA
jgi:MarR family transcriptional regulator for hemolysin